MQFLLLMVKSCLAKKKNDIDLIMKVYIVCRNYLLTTISKKIALSMCQKLIELA